MELGKFQLIQEKVQLHDYFYSNTATISRAMETMTAKTTAAATATATATPPFFENDTS